MLAAPVRPRSVKLLVLCSATIFVGGALCSAAGAGGESGASATATDQPTPPERPSAKKPAGGEQSAARVEGGQVNGRWREGSRLVDQHGYFKVSNEHVTFISSDSKLRFDALENLAVERIARTIGDSPDQLEWSISGTITECRGSNYLLISQAVLKSKSSRARRTP